jgi:hypothetical protein
MDLRQLHCAWVCFPSGPSALRKSFRPQNVTKLRTMAYEAAGFRSLGFVGHRLIPRKRPATADARYLSKTSDGAALAVTKHAASPLQDVSRRQGREVRHA